MVFRYILLELQLPTAQFYTVLGKNAIPTEFS
jgi:hypothetical protein